MNKPVTYTLTTLNRQRSRVLEETELKSVLRVALSNGWQPLPKRIHGSELRMDGALDEIEAMELAAALERGLKRSAATLPPPLMIAIMETIGVLRHDSTKLYRNP
jgi:hypothetical protein